MAKRAKGDGGLFRRKSDGLWVGRLVLPDGTRKQFAAKTQADARKRLEAARLTVQQGLPITSDKLKVADFLEQWLEQSAKPKMKASSYRSCEELVRLHISPALGHHKLARLQPGHVQTLLNAKRESGLSARRVEYIHGVLRAALNRAMKWGLIHRNVATLVDLPGGPRAEIAPLDPEAASALLTAAVGNRHQHVFAFLLATGLRLGEALGLRWSDVDLDGGGSLTVRHTLERLPGQPWRLTEPKSAAGKRTIPLIAPARTALKAQHARIAAMRLKALAWPTTTSCFPPK